MTDNASKEGSPVKASDLPPSITDAAKALRAGDITSTELVSSAFSMADKIDPRLGVYLSRFEDTALEAADQADGELASGQDRGPLHGIPIGVKDVILTREGPTTGNSHVTNPAWAGGRDAATIANLRHAGAIIMGKVSANEFAFGAPDEDDSWLFPRNPWDPDRWAGGSSSGSGSGVAAGLFLGAVGTDTAGSVRMPAAYCGIVGFKQTNGILSNDGVIPLSWSLDQVGALAHTVEDVALMTQAMATPPARESESPGGALALTERLGRSIEGMRIGVDRRNHLDRPQADPALAERFEAAVDELERLGAQISEIEIPHYAEIVDATMITIYVEGFAYHREHLREQLDRFCVASRLGFLGGALFTAADYVIVQRARAAAVTELVHLFNTVDVVVSPTVVNVAPSVSEGYDMGQVVAGLATPIWNGVGNPAITVPMGFNDDGLPLGLQIAGRHHEDSLVLQIAAAYENATNWDQNRPALLSLAKAESEV